MKNGNKCCHLCGKSMNTDAMVCKECNQENYEDYRENFYLMKNGFDYVDGDGLPINFPHPI